MIKSSKLMTLYAALIILASAVVTLSNLGWHKYFIGNDAGITFYFPNRMIKFYYYTWDGFSAPGKLNVTPLFSFLWGNFIYLIHKLGLSSFFIERLTYFLFFFISGISFFFLFQLLFRIYFYNISSKLLYLASFTGSLLYMFNHFTMSITSFPIYPYHLSYMFFPLMLALFIYNLQIKTSFSSILSFLAAFLLLANGNPSNTISITLFLALYLLFFFKDIKEKTTTRPFFFLTIAGIFILFLCSYVYLPMFGIGSNPYGKYALIREPQASFSFNSLYTSFLNLFRLSGVNIWPNYSYYQLYTENAIFIFLGYLIPIFAVFSFLSARAKRTKIFLGIVIILSLFFAKGVHPPFANFFLYLSSKIPCFAMYRAVYYKFVFYAVLSYSILVSFFTIDFFYFLKKYRSRFVYFILFIPFSLLVYNVPFFTGKVVTKEYLTLMPQEYKEIESLFSRDSTDYKIITLPPSPGGRGLLLDWGNENLYVGAYPDAFFFNRPALDSYWFIAYRISSGTSWEDTIFSENVNSIFNFIKILNVKYVFLHKDFMQRYNFKVGGGLKLLNGPLKSKIIEDNLGNLSAISLVKDSSNYIIYKIEPDRFLPHIYSSTVPWVVEGGVNALGSLAKTKYLEGKPVLFFRRQKKNKKLISMGNIPHLAFLNNEWRVVRPRVVKIKEEATQKNNKDASTNSLWLRVQRGGPEIAFKRINPTKYLVKVSKAKYPFWLVFLESFHKQWRIYKTSEPYSSIAQEFKEIVADYPKLGVKEVRHLMKFTPSDIKFLLRKPLEAKHMLVNVYANGWYIEPRKLGLGQDFVLTIYFFPQSLFYLGLGISGLTLLCCLACLAYDYLKKRRSKERG